MGLTYYHSSETGPHISVTFPPRTAVISRATHPIPRSFIFTHLHSFFPLRFFLFPPLPFSEFLLLATSCYQPFLPLAVYLFIPPHLLPFCSFLAIHHFFFLSPSFLTFTSHFMVICLFRGLSPFLNCLSVSVCASSYTTSAHSVSSANPFHLSLSVLALSRNPCLSFGSILFIFFSVSPSSVFSYSLSLYFPRQLSFVWHPADKAADKGEREHI